MAPEKQDVDFHFQFLLTPSDVFTRSHWNNLSVPQGYLRTHPAVPVVEVTDADGATAGVLLGHAIDQDGALVERPLRLPAGAFGQAGNAALDSFVDQFSGRFVFLFLYGDIQRLYPDAGATLGVVFSRERRTVASTVSLLLSSEPGHPYFQRSSETYPSNRPNKFYPAGLTAVEGIERLLPGHTLDLKTLRQVRYWPASALDRYSPDEALGQVDEIVQRISTNIGAVVERHDPVYMPLTAGRDSRMLLACSRKWAPQIRYVTFDYSRPGIPRNSQVDVYMARKLAKRFGLRHEILGAPPATDGLRKKYLLTIGHSGSHGKARDFLAACQSHLELDAAWLTGFGGEVGRGFYSRHNDRQDRPLSARELLRRIRLPETEDFINAVEGWNASLPGGDTFLQLDLAYLELRLGCWASPHMYGAAPFRLNLTPFSGRDVLEKMIRLPAEYRFRQNLARDVLRLSWPELLDLPFN